MPHLLHPRSLPLPWHAPRKQDYGCLFQKGADGSPRSPVQQQCFGAALDTMQLWYAHNKLCAFILSEFPLARRRPERARVRCAWMVRSLAMGGPNRARLLAFASAHHRHSLLLTTTHCFRMDHICPTGRRSSVRGPC